MKRTPLKPSIKPLKRTPLARKTGIRAKTPIQRISKKTRRQLYGDNGYIAFSRALRRAYPMCQIQWEHVCTGQSQGVHHVIKRSQGGALVPGEDATLQGQEFVAACNACNHEVERQPRVARERGWVKSHPGRRSVGST